MTKEQAGILGSEPHTGGLAIPSTKHKPPKNLADGMIKALRPRQWVKNVLVLAAPMAAGSVVLLNRRTIIDVAIAFAVFCMAASAIYLVNDAKDVEADRAHPTKQFRPIAAGVLPVGLAYGMAVLLIAGSVGVSLLASSGRNLAIVMAIYIVLQLGYCFGWKHLPVIDIALVSSGFMLRAMAGGVAAGITLSQWFLLVAAFGSLFMASGKRYAEILLAEKSGAKIRKALEGYTPTYLRFVWPTWCSIMAPFGTKFQWCHLPSLSCVMRLMLTVVTVVLQTSWHSVIAPFKYLRSHGSDASPQRSILPLLCPNSYFCENAGQGMF